jgi:hypothetical protein
LGFRLARICGADVDLEAFLGALDPEEALVLRKTEV